MYFAAAGRADYASERESDKNLSPAPPHCLWPEVRHCPPAFDAWISSTGRRPILPLRRNEQRLLDRDDFWLVIADGCEDTRAGLSKQIIRPSTVSERADTVVEERHAVEHGEPDEPGAGIDAENGGIVIGPVNHLSN